MLDLYVCLRPVQYFKGVPSPVKHPEKVDMVIFRENTEDIYAGIEYAAGTPEAQEDARFSREGISEGVRQDSLRHERESGGILESGRRAGFSDDVHGRHRHQAGQPLRQRAPDPQRDQLRDPEQAQERHARAQGQHHEVHRRRVSRLGLRGREERISARKKSMAARGAKFPRANRAPAS